MAPTGPRLVLASIAAALLASGAASAESSIRCEGGIVAIGDTRLDLLAKCGAPTLSEARLLERGEWLAAEGANAVTSLRARTTVERWTYDFGTGRFIQVVALEAGKVKAVERGGYGYAKAPSRDRPRIEVSRCDGSAIAVGITKYELLSKCGEPAVKVRGEQERATSIAQSGDSAVTFATETVAIDVWTYNFGPDRFVLTATMVDGKVVEVERGGYGYPERS